MKKSLHLILENEEIEIHCVTSDTHVGHKNIAKYTGRPYENTQDTRAMDKDLVRLWNGVVGDEDNVLHLGDAALGQIVESVKWYGKTNGTKFLVPGNHEYISSVSSNGAKRRETYAPVYAEFFTVLPEEVMLLARSGEMERVIRASHYPTVGDPREGDKYDKQRPPVDDGVPLIHGHTHLKDALNPLKPLEYHVGADAHKLKPISAEVIVDWVFGLEQ